MATNSLAMFPEFTLRSPSGLPLRHVYSARASHTGKTNTESRTCVATFVSLCEPDAHASPPQYLVRPSFVALS